MSIIPPDDASEILLGDFNGMHRIPISSIDFDILANRRKQDFRECPHASAPLLDCGVCTVATASIVFGRSDGNYKGLCTPYHVANTKDLLKVSTFQFLDSIHMHSHRPQDCSFRAYKKHLSSRRRRLHFLQLLERSYAEHRCLLGPHYRTAPRYMQRRHTAHRACSRAAHPCCFGTNRYYCHPECIDTSVSIPSSGLDLSGQTECREVFPSRLDCERTSSNRYIGRGKGRISPRFSLRRTIQKAFQPTRNDGLSVINWNSTRQGSTYHKGNSQRRNWPLN